MLCLCVSVSVQQVTTETDELRFNTAIASMMEFINGVYKSWGDSRCGCGGVWWGLAGLLRGWP